MSSIEKAIDRLSKVKAQNKIKTQVDGALTDTATKNKELYSSSDIGERKENLGAGLAPRGEKQADEIKVSIPKAERSETAGNTPMDFTLDFKALKKSGYLTPDSNNKVLSEEYRAIKRPVLINAFGKGAAPIERGNLIAVTSSLPGEGKTYTTLNLALSIATELDSTVLLIDGDILRPQLSVLLRLQGNKGLTNVLHEPDTGISDVLVSTQIPKLKILPSGYKYENSTELLSSDGMERLVIELGERYSDRIVLFDSPPLLATSEATVLNHLMGQILLVVEAGKTPIDAVKDSLTHLNDEKVIGLVLNKTTGHAGRIGYGSYGGYG